VRRASIPGAGAGELVEPEQELRDTRRTDRRRIPLNLVDIIEATPSEGTSRRPAAAPGTSSVVDGHE